MLLRLTIGVSLQLAEVSSNNATVDCCRNVCIVSANVIRFFSFSFLLQYAFYYGFLHHCLWGNKGMSTNVTVKTTFWIKVTLSER